MGNSEYIIFETFGRLLKSAELHISVGNQL